MFSVCWRVSVLMTAAAGAVSASTNTPGLTGLKKDGGDAIVNEAGCAVITRYPMVLLPIFQCTAAAHVFIKPFTPVINVCVGTPSSGAIVHSGKVDNIGYVGVVMLSFFCRQYRSVKMPISSNDF